MRYPESTVGLYTTISYTYYKIQKKNKLGPRNVEWGTVPPKTINAAELYSPLQALFIAKCVSHLRCSKDTGERKGDTV